MLGLKNLRAAALAAPLLVLVACGDTATPASAPPSSAAASAAASKPAASAAPAASTAPATSAAASAAPATSAAGSTAPASGAAPASGGASSCVQQAQAQLTQAAQPAKMIIPSAQVPAAKLAGKKVWVITPTLGVPLVANIMKGLTEAAQAAGIEATIIDGKGAVTTQSAGFAQAVAQKADAVVLDGLAPDLFSGPMDDAKKAGIPVIGISLYPSPSDPLPAGVFVNVGVDYVQAGKTQALYALTQSNCDGNFVLFSSSVSKTLQGLTKSNTDTIKSLCPACQVSSEELATNDISTKGVPLAQVDIQKDPKLKYFVAADQYLLTIAPAIQQMGAGAHGVKALGFQGDDANLAFVRDGAIEVATVSNPPIPYIGWVTVDELLRAMAGMPAVPGVLPQQLITTENYPKSGTPFDSFGDFRAAFKANWGKA